MKFKKPSVTLIIASLALALGIWNYFCIVTLYNLIKVLGEALDELYFMLNQLFDLVIRIMSQMPWQGG